jgi:hypothetical protein
MRRLNRSTNTPLGTAFFLFVSLAIIPVSLKAAGLKLGFSPRLSAAIDIWTEITETFGSNYGAAGGSQLAELIVPAENSQSAARNEPCPLRERACARQIEESSTEVEQPSPISRTMPAATTINTAKASRPGCRLTVRSHTESKPVTVSAAPAEITFHVDTDVRSYRALSDRRVEATMRRDVLTRLDRIINQHGFEQPAIAPTPKSFRMHFRFRQTAMSSLTGAECKARMALDAALRVERASLNGESAAPDNCDL